jgi:hypothetical protein
MPKIQPLFLFQILSEFSIFYKLNERNVYQTGLYAVWDVEILPTEYHVKIIWRVTPSASHRE